jgi:hypothetical protein
MKVADLQLFLRQIGPFAKAAGASDKAFAELERAGQCLEPFREQSLADFSDFVAKTAEHYARTGEFAQIVKPAKGRATTRAPKAPKISLTDAAATFQGLYDRATDPTLEYGMIDVEIDKFTSFTVAQLKELAKSVGITLAGKATKPLILEAFKSRIKERKGSHERNQFRPAEGGTPAG